jgi:hypothetical protein
VSISNGRESSWKGVPIRDLTREELIEALEWSHREIERMRAQSQKYLRNILNLRRAGV